MRAPLLVHLVHHPRSDEARRIARAVYQALNADPALPGLRIPVRILEEDGKGSPPAAHDFDEAERNVVVVLADDTMVLEDDPAAHWPAFVDSLAHDGKRRFIPVQLSDDAWPLHEGLKTTNFLRAQAGTEIYRTGKVIRGLVIELCRMLLNQPPQKPDEPPEPVPVKIFLSHAKHDIGQEPKIFAALVEHLDATKPVEAWVDSAQIRPGTDFGDAIRKGVRECGAVLAIATTNYGSRPWCRTEILIAKEQQKPLVVIDGMREIDVRTFPYLGNAPLMAWTDGSAARAVDLLLKELLRQLHVKLLLGNETPKVKILTAAPELATVVGLPPESTVRYPDPPLGDEELKVMSPLKLRFETPLQAAASGAPLKGKVIALSISEADDTHRYGALPEQLDAALLEISRHLLVRGASLAYGGHLGSKGYTEALFDLVRAHNDQSGLPPAEVIRNYVGWPVPYKTVPAQRRAHNKLQADWRRVPRPDGVANLEPATFVEEPEYFDDSSPARRYAWARGMTAMREQMAAETGARIILGGKIRPAETARPDGTKKKEWYKSRIPGVLEEALLTIRAGKPLFVCGGFGGASRAVAELLSGGEYPDLNWAYQSQAPHAKEMRELYGAAFEDYPAIQASLRGLGIEGLSKLNGLSEKANRELFQSRDIPRIVELLLAGLTKPG